MTDNEIALIKAEIIQLDKEIADLDRDILEASQIIVNSESYALVKEAYVLQSTAANFINDLDSKSLCKQPLPDANENTVKALTSLLYNMENYGYRNTDAYLHIIASEELLNEFESKRQEKFTRRVQLAQQLETHGVVNDIACAHASIPAKSFFFQDPSKKIPTQVNELYEQYAKNYRQFLYSYRLKSVLPTIQALPSAANTKALEKQRANPRTSPSGMNFS